MCTLLQQLEAQAVPAQQSWELYQLLQQLGGAQQLPPQGVLAVCSVQFALSSLQCAVSRMQCAVYSVQWAVCSVHNA